MESNKIYNSLVEKAIANGGQLLSKYVDDKLEFHEPKTRCDIVIKLDKNGYIKRTSVLPSLLNEFKHHWDNNGLQMLRDDGVYTFKPSDPSLLDCIMPSNLFPDGKLICESQEYYVGDKKQRDEIDATINNGNKSNSLRRLKTKIDADKLAKGSK